MTTSQKCREHFLHLTTSELLFRRNVRIEKHDFRSTLQLGVFIFLDKKLLLVPAESFSSSSLSLAAAEAPDNECGNDQSYDHLRTWTIPTRDFFEPVRPAEKDSLAWQALELVQEVCCDGDGGDGREDSAVGAGNGEVRMLDFAFDTALERDLDDGRTVTVAAVVVLTGDAAAQARKKMRMKALPSSSTDSTSWFDVAVLTGAGNKKKQLQLPPCMPDIPPPLLMDAVARYRSFAAQCARRRESPAWLGALCLNAVDALLMQRAIRLRAAAAAAAAVTATATHDKEAKGKGEEEVEWAVLAQVLVPHYPFEGLFIMPLREDEYCFVAQRGYTKFRHRSWWYGVVGSVNLLHLRGRRRQQQLLQQAGKEATADEVDASGQGHSGAGADADADADAGADGEGRPQMWLGGDPVDLTQCVRADGVLKLKWLKPHKQQMYNFAHACVKAGD